MGDTYNRLNDLGSEVWFINVGSEVFIESGDSFGVNKRRVSVCYFSPDGLFPQVTVGSFHVCEQDV